MTHSIIYLWGPTHNVESPDNPCPQGHLVNRAQIVAPDGAVVARASRVNDQWFYDTKNCPESVLVAPDRPGDEQELLLRQILTGLAGLFDNNIF